MDRRKTFPELSPIEKRIIREIQGDLPLCEEPFREIARRIGISEEEVLSKVREWMERGIIRRFGATLRHQLVGFDANAMSAWRVPEGEVERVGEVVASYRQVTHCYERPAKGDWAYNLFAMIHGRSEEECMRIAEEISKRTGIEDYLLLFSHEENKKETMQYF